MATIDETQVKIKERLSCALCFEIYKSPQILPCFHSFCKTCVEKLGKKNGGLECPLCRKFAKEASIKDNFFLNDLSDLIKEIECGEKVCGQCDGKDSKWKCMDCKILLCQPCFTLHLKIPVCKGHKVIKIEQVENSAILDKIVYCYNHTDEIIKFHCKTCQQPICIQCKILDHDSHTAETIDSAIAEILAKISAIQDKYQKRITNGKVYKNMLELSKSDINKSYLNVEENVKETANALIKRITADCTRIANQLETERKNQIVTIDKNISKLDNSLKESQSVFDWATTVVSKSKGATLMQGYYSGLNQKHENLDKHEDSMKPLDTISINYPTFDKNGAVPIKQSLIGKVSYRPQKVLHLTKVPMQIIEASNYNIKQFLSGTVLLNDCIVLEEVNTKNRMIAFMKDTFWVPLEIKKNILLVSIKDKSQRLFSTNSINPIAVAAIDLEPWEVALASLQGLWFIKVKPAEDLTWKILDEGIFHQVVHCNGTLAAVCSSSNQVKIYKGQTVQDYKCVTTIPYTADKLNIHIQLTSDHVYLHFRLKYTVEKYSIDGKSITTIKTKTPDFTPNEDAKLCIVDANESFMFSDWYNSLIEAHITEENQPIKDIKHLTFKPEMDYINDMLFLDSQTLVVLAGNKLHFLKSE